MEQRWPGAAASFRTHRSRSPAAPPFVFLLAVAASFSAYRVVAFSQRLRGRRGVHARALRDAAHLRDVVRHDSLRTACECSQADAALHGQFPFALRSNTQTSSYMMSCKLSTIAECRSERDSTRSRSAMRVSLADYGDSRVDSPARGMASIDQ